MSSDRLMAGSLGKASNESAYNTTSAFSCTDTQPTHQVSSDPSCCKDRQQSFNHLSASDGTKMQYNQDNQQIWHISGKQLTFHFTRYSVFGVSASNNNLMPLTSSTSVYPSVNTRPGTPPDPQDDAEAAMHLLVLCLAIGRSGNGCP